jgi:succinyl-CoA synthetase beta subunit
LLKLNELSVGDEDISPESFSLQIGLQLWWIH